MEEDKIYIDLQKVPLKSEREEIRQRRRKRFLIFLFCMLFFVLGLGGGYLIRTYIEPKYDADAKNTMGQLEYLMNRQWLYGKEYEDLTKEMENKAFYGMTAFEFDPYTTYMSAEEMEEFSTGINMNYVGIGVEYMTVDDLSVVHKVFKNSPAEEAGILSGDIIETVDGNSILGLSSSEIKEMVVGPEGTEVRIGVSRGGERLELTCIRGPIDSSVYAWKENDYVVLELNSFGNLTGKECIKYLDEYTDVDKIIIDLRDDTGGYQSSVKEICGLFIGNDKVYLRERDVNGVEAEDYTKAARYYDNFKQIVLLVNGSTASAAEVFTICLKEQHPNVTIVGTKTFGKGVIQTNHTLNNGGVLKMTAYYWLSPNGVSIHGEGIVPDEEVYQAPIAYEYYVMMEEDETVPVDSVSEFTRIAQLSLDYLGYDVKREDGYFDEAFRQILKEYRNDRGLEDPDLLDPATYHSIISDTIRTLNSDPEKDYQFVRAKEILNGN